MITGRPERQVGSSEFEESYDDDRQFVGEVFGEALSKIPLRPLLLVKTTDTVGDAIQAMNDRHVGVSIVVDASGKLAGILTERDVLRKVAGRDLDLKTQVAKVMTSHPETLPPHASIACALHKMSIEGYRHIPLVSEDGRPRGVVGVRDIVGWLVELFPESLLNLPPEPLDPQRVEGG
jgi:CBS domain-containing protein